MEPTNSSETSDPRYHTRNVIGMYDGLIEHLRADIGKMDDPQARAMFETSAEVVRGLRTAFEHYLSGAETAWRN